MKKYVVMSVALMIGSLIFAQKKEVKAIEKAIKSGDFATAKSGVQVAEGLLSAMDNKTKAKFYFLKGQALYADGKGTDNELTESINAFNQVSDIENELGKFIYKPQIETIKQGIIGNLYEKGQQFLEEKNFKEASNSFEKAYRVSPRDTVYLYNSALLSQNGQNFDRALDLYDELIKLGYTGITTEYYATNNESGKEELFPSKSLRDVALKSSYSNPKDEKKESKVGDIVKNVALIYVAQGKNDEAIKAIERAKSINPNDFSLLTAEANIQYKIGNKDKYKELIQKAIELEPDNVDLIYNLGVVASEVGDVEDAKKHYDHALKLDPKYINALMANALLIISQEQGIVDQMNSLGTSSADNKKFDELQAQRQKLYTDAIPYLNKALEVNPKYLDAAKTLMNLYGAIDDSEKFNEMKAKVAAIEAGN
ncbi:tetratricopeptide repeat protein [Flavobacteriaceae bacterium AU392]|nr:tetratricopeptide repeat protein [Flavobacteriaceae bacterium]RKM85703.1 tetratricopeptide repeat protein [Flavobacteriaceae bacterium AU392]